jgi:alpha-tubulin suppressor-like RCC1 family protein
MVLRGTSHRTLVIHCLSILLLGITTASAGVVTWGLDDVGQLGLRRPLHVAVPEMVNQTGVLAGKQIVQVVGGMNHTLALSSTGEIYAWGGNDHGQLGTADIRPMNEPVEVPMAAFAGKTVVGLAAGNNFSLAWTQDGKVFAWGNSEFGQCGQFSKRVPLPTLIDAEGWVKKLVTGNSFVLALTTQGKVLSWGDNRYGQLGDGTQEHSSVPHLVSASLPFSTATITDISAGHYHSLALASDGRVYSWGSNGFGQLGRTGASTLLPDTVDMSGALAGKKVRKMTAGYAHTLVLADDGRLYAWGDNSDNTYLGNYEFTGNRSTLPLAVRMQEFGSRQIVQITSGYFHSMALAEDGTLFSWGFNGGRQLGGGAFQTSLKVPSEMLPSGSRKGKTLLTLADQAMGGCVHALTSDGSLIGWGWNHSGQVGNRAQAWRTSPVDVMPETHTGAGAKVAVSQVQTLMIGGHASSYGSANLFGWGSFLPTNGISNELKPRPTAVGMLEGQSGWRCVAGMQHSLFVDGDGVLHGFGDNRYGQLGNGSTFRTNSLVPVATDGVLAGKSYFQIMAGANHSLVLTTDGGLYAWGRNHLGQLGIGHTADNHLPVSVDLTGELAGKVPAFIAAGDDHSLVVTMDGHVYAWGLNDQGQLGDGTQTNRLSAVEVPLSGALAGKMISKAWAGSTHTFVQATDGTLFGWGSNDHGQLGTGTVSTEELVAAPVVMNGALAGKTIAKITAGKNFTLILCSDGSVCGMGENRFGSLGTGDREDRHEPTAITFTTSLAGRIITDLGAAKSGYSVSAITQATVPELLVGGYSTPTPSFGSEDSVYNGQLAGLPSTRPAAFFHLRFENKAAASVKVSNFHFTGPDASAFRLAAAPPAVLGPEMTLQSGAIIWLIVNATGSSNATQFATLHFTTEDPAYAVLDIPLEMRSTEAGWGVNIGYQQSGVTINNGEPLHVQPVYFGVIERYAWTKSGSTTVISNRPFLHFDHATMADAGLYEIKVYGTGATINESFKRLISINIIPTPRITRQPVPITTGPGEVAAFTVEGESPSGTLTYQWFFGDEAIPGATSATLTLQPVIPDMAGEYEVRLTNDAGTSRSQKVTLTVELGAPVQADTISDIAFTGEPVSLESNVYGVLPLQLQWYKSGKLIPKATGWSYSPATKMSSAAMGTYSYTVSNAEEATPQPSAPGWLGMMKRAPAAASVVAGKYLELTCTASSPPETSLAYEWKRNGESLNGRAFVFGQLTAKLKITQAEFHHAGAYTCEVSMTTPLGKITRSHGSTALTVFEVPSLTPESTELPPVRVGQLVTHSLVGVKNPTSYKASGLPPGIKINSTTGQLSGRPTAARLVKGVNVPYKLRLTATNPAGSTTLEIDWLVLPLQEIVVGQFFGIVDRSVEFNEIPPMSTGLGGRFQLTMTSKGGSSGSLTLGTMKHSLKGDWNLTSADDGTVEGSFTLVRKRPSPSLTLTATIDTLTGRLSGDLTDGTSHAKIIAWRMTPDPLRAGSYNAALQAGGAPQDTRPSGAGITTLKVSATGQANWTGRLADGTSVTSGAGVGASGDVPLHLLLYAGKGSIQGWNQISTDASWDGTLDWVKATTAGGTSYPAGFDLHAIYLTGRKYIRAPSGGNLLGYPEVGNNALLRLSSGSLTTPITQVFTMTPGQTASLPPSHSLKLILTPTTGWFKGSFKSSDTPARNGTIQGILLPGADIGVGHFLQAVSAAEDPTKPVKSGLVEIFRN